MKAKKAKSLFSKPVKIMHSIIDYINKIRQAPEPVKQRVVLMWTIILIIIIVLIWSLSLLASVANRQAEDEALRLEAQKLVEEKKLALASATSSPNDFPGLIPMARDFVINFGDNISAGFWVLGDKLHK